MVGPLEMIRLASTRASIRTSIPMSKSASTPSPGSRSGPGPKPISDADYLIRWSGIVESLKAGMIAARINEKFETCGHTVLRVRRIMEAGGWTPPERPKYARPKREPRPPKPGMTADERLAKYPGIVAQLQGGKTRAEVAALEGVSINTVRVVRRALAAQMR